MSRNKKKLKMQMLEKLDSQNRIKTKKDKEGGGCTRASGVHSIASMRTYRSSFCSFAEWVKLNHSTTENLIYRPTTKEVVALSVCEKGGRSRIDSRYNIIANQTV